VSSCPRPLDPIDAEAVAGGAGPVFATDAALHAAGCAWCGELVRAAQRLAVELDRFSGAPVAAPDLVERVIRLRSFSRRERRTYALWRAPLLICGALLVAGLLLLAWPGLSVREQTGLGTALTAPLVALGRSIGRWAGEMLSHVPPGLEALSEALHRDRGLGLAALLLLGPAGLAVRRVLARAKDRR